MNAKIYEKYVNARSDKIEDNSINVIEELNSYASYGYDDEFNLCFILKTDGNLPQAIRTSKLSLELNHRYKIDHEIDMNINLIRLINGSDNEIKAFIRFCNVFISNYSETISTEEVYDLFTSLKNLFSDSKKKTLDDAIGLFGELVFICYIYNEFKINLVNYYRKKNVSKYDFNLSEKHKIEIKTTTRMNRLHQINHEQLFPEDKEVLLASVLLRYDDSGITLSDLFDRLISLFDVNLTTKSEVLNEISDCGDFAYNQRFDLQYAISKINIFINQDLPKICNQYPSYIKNVQYSISLDNVDTLSTKDVLNFIDKVK